jgi:hypothetical protein
LGRRVYDGLHDAILNDTINMVIELFGLQG